MNNILRKFNILLTWVLILFAATGCYNSQEKRNTKYQNQLQGYVAIENGKLFYQKFGSGEPMIIVHGGPGLDQSYLLPQMLELAKGYELIFYDQRGSGRSLEVNIDPKYVTLNQFTEDLEKLRSKLELKKFILVGHSWGGLLSMNYAIKHPEKVSFLILLTPAPADYSGQKSFLEEFTTRIKPVEDKISAFFDYKEFNKLDAKQINQLYRNLFSVYFKNHAQVNKLTLEMSKKSAISGFQVNALMSKTSWLRPEVNLFPDLRKLNVPTLIISCNQDIVPTYTAREIKDAIPVSQIVCLNNCGHFPYIETPDDLFKSIRSFLSATDGK